MKTKICTKCDIVMVLSKFSKDKQKKDGYYSSCKECERKYLQKYYKKNKKTIQESSRNTYHNNKNKILKRDKIKRKLFPYEQTFKYIKSRCENLNIFWLIFYKES